MNSKVNSLLKYITAFCLVAIFLSNSTDPPNGRTGAPGDGVCSSCHSGNNFEGNITINGVPTVAIGGETYSIGVTVKNTDAMAVRAGFQMVSLFNGDFLNAGGFKPDSNDEGISVAGGRTYIEHRGAKNFQDSVAQWIFDWEAPIVDEEKVIVMFAAGNIANGGGSSGDAIKFKDLELLVRPPAVELVVEIDVNQIECAGGTGSLEALASGGTEVYSYQWSNGSTESLISEVLEGMYSVTVTDSNDSMTIATAMLLEPDPIVIEVDVIDESGNNLMDGAISSTVAGGTPPYAYNWSNGETSPNLQNLSQGTYTLEITDSNGCIETLEIEVGGVACDFSIGLNFNQITCAGASDGEATIDPVDFEQPLSFEWSNGETDFIAIAGLSPGDYAVTVTDGSGCVVVEEFTIIDPLPVDVDFILMFNDCDNELDNSLLALTTGGSGTYSYLWSNGSTESELTDVELGLYQLTVTDDQGCTLETEVDFQVIDSDFPVITYTDSISLYIDAEGVVDVSPLNIEVTDNCGVLEMGFDAMINCNIVDAQILNYSAMDVNGNISNADIYITGIIDTFPPVIITCVEDIIQSGCDTVFYDLPTAMDNCGIESMEMTEGLPSGSVFPKDSTQVTFNFYDANGNLTCCSFWVVTTNDLTLTIDEVVDASPNEGGSISISASGGAGDFSYEWTFNDTLVVSNFEDVSGLDPGSYKVKITDASGCVILSEAILIEMSSSIYEEIVSKLSFSPNPVENWISLEAESYINQVRIFSINGQFLRAQSNTEKSKSMLISISDDFEAGLYLMQVELEEGYQTIKFIKK